MTSNNNSWGDWHREMIVFHYLSRAIKMYVLDGFSHVCALFALSECFNCWIIPSDRMVIFWKDSLCFGDSHSLGRSRQFRCSENWKIRGQFALIRRSRWMLKSFYSSEVKDFFSVEVWGELKWRRKGFQPDWLDRKLLDYFWYTKKVSESKKKIRICHRENGFSCLIIAFEIQLKFHFFRNRIQSGKNANCAFKIA